MAQKNIVHRHTVHKLLADKPWPLTKRLDLLAQDPLYIPSCFSVTDFNGMAVKTHILKHRGISDYDISTLQL